LFTGEVAFSKPKPGGLVGDGEFAFMLENTDRRFGLMAEVGVFRVEDLSGVV
jgi:hypothetical protein